MTTESRPYARDFIESIETGKPQTSAIERAELLNACREINPELHNLCRKVLQDLDQADQYVRKAKAEANAEYEEKRHRSSW